jgi:hypothetical protein
VTRHAEYTLRRASIAEILNLALAVPASEAVGTESLVTGQDGQVLDLVAAVVAAVCAVVAYQRAVAEEQQVRIRVEEGAARVAAEAVDVPSVSSWALLACYSAGGASCAGGGGRREGRCVSLGNAYRVRRPFLPRGSRLPLAIARIWVSCPYLSASLARVDYFILERRLWVCTWTVHSVLVMCTSST